MNPYEVLGVPENADKETIKKAYKELVKKYHPDKYVNNPLADLATEKMKEINNAYDMLMNGQSGSSSGNSRSGNNYSGSYNTGNANFQTVRMLISSRNFAAATSMLQSLPQTAEWHYLMGLCKINTGMYDAGINFIRTAVSMDPNNFEYRSTLNNIENRNTAYRQYNTGNMGGCMGDPCSCCSNLICLDCLCECLGGDLISCC